MIQGHNKRQKRGKTLIKKNKKLNTKRESPQRDCKVILNHRPHHPDGLTHRPKTTLMTDTILLTRVALGDRLF